MIDGVSHADVHTINLNKMRSFCSLVDRHRMVNEALSEELSAGLHALSIVAKTEEQWRKMVDDGRAAVEGSPQCRGGFGK